MASPTLPYLSKCGEIVVRKLFKTIRATRYEDPVDQEAFLVSSAKTVLRFRPQVMSFAIIPDLAECVFTLRSMMHSLKAPLGTLSSDVFLSLQEFASEIIRQRQVFRERKRAQADRVRAAEGVAARAERRAALEHSERVHKNLSPDDDVVSIPSGSEESASEEPPAAPKNPPSSPITTDLTNNPAINQAVLLSPLHDLPAHLARLSLNAIPNTPPCSPLSPNLSLPDLVPDFTLGRHNLPEKGSGWKRGRTMVRHRQILPVPTPVVQCNTVRLVPRPFGPPPTSPKRKYVDAWLQFNPKSTDSCVLKSSSLGSSGHSKNRRPAPRKRHTKKPKRCYYCAAVDHLVALCPMRESID
ncbi:hypothetical protein MVEN_00882000 [Mycena venus]|uniref:Uncharacterized protein n=1 Tax=Mycena venus TaxID=2733690 RepID=A0A8H6YI00_9AGAR|nr:hypothetical protein MVEN_00882000 [Mycena venus]